MSIAVKSFLNVEGGNPEIRRFSVPEDVGANFAYLVEKIQRTYPELLRQEFKLFWQDRDNDLIRFTSDEELVEALGNIQTDLFKVFIKLIPAVQQDGSSEPPKHPGVHCDVCENSIVGTRFKCLICPDYDLCGSCEGKGFHPEHEMLRIRTPRRHPFQGLWQVLGGFPRGRRGKCGRHRGGPSMKPPHRGHHGPFGNHGPFGHSGPHGPFGHHGPNGHPPPPFVPPFDPKGNYGPWGGCGETWAPSNEDKGSNDKKETSENQEESVPPFFNAMGDMIASFLEPFGIDVETYADNPDEPCNCGDDPAKNGESDRSESTVPNDNQAEATSQITDQQEVTKTQNEVTADGHQDSPMAQGDGYVVVEKDKPNQQNQEEILPYARVQEQLFQQRLQEATKRMHDMGFNNEGGWLTQLLISKNCNIPNVLDILYSQAK